MGKRLFVAVMLLVLMLCCVGAFAEDVHHTVTFHSGTDGLFSDGTDIKIIDYGEPSSQQVSKKVHTSNISSTGSGVDDARPNGWSGFSGYRNESDVAVIPGATSLHVKLICISGNTNAWVCAWEGKHPNYSASANYGTSVIGKLSGGTYDSSTWVTREFDVQGDAVSFGYFSPYGNNVGQLGYSAAVIATMDNSSVVNGQYEEPLANDRSLSFVGWNTSPDGTGTMYVSGSMISETCDVYAIYQDDAYASGTYDGVSWKITNSGELILGNGTDQTFTNRSYRYNSGYPWYPYRHLITSVRINGTVHGRGDMGHMFEDQVYASTMDFTGFDTSAITSMSSMFYNCKGLTALDVSGFDTSNVTSMYNMFCYCSGLTSLDVSGFDTSNVTNMYRMFDYCSGVTSLNVSGFNTSKVTDMSSMFSSCRGLATLDVSRFDTSNVVYMNGMFSGCSGLTSLDVSGFDTSKATETSSMFSGCSGLTSLDVSGFNTSKVTNMSGMFSSCSGLTSLDVSEFDTSNVLYMSSMFAGCRGLTSLDVSGFDTSKVTSIGSMFYYCSGLTSLDVSGFNTSNVKYMSYMFYHCDGLTSLDVSGFDTSNVTEMQYLFAYCSRLKTVDVSAWNTSNVIYMGGLFSDCYALTSIDVSGWNTVNVRDMHYLFYRCYQLKEIDVSGWITSNVTNMSYIFYYCDDLKALDISGWDTSHVTSMSCMFYYCGVPSLDLRNFDTSSATNMQQVYDSPYIREVILSENNPFIGNGVTSDLRAPTVNSPQNGVYYTGKWIYKSGAYGPYTPAELRGNLTAEMAGKWVWEVENSDFFISFVTTDESVLGTMDDVVGNCRTFYKLPANEFTKAGYVFDHWESDGGVSYANADVIYGNTYSPGATVVLTPVFVEAEPSSVNMVDGSFDIRIMGGETAVVDGIPSGTAYQVYEETPSGWVLVEAVDTHGTVELSNTPVAKFANEYSPESVSVRLVALKYLDGVLAETESFNFELVDENGDVLQIKSVSENGVVMFESLEFTESDIGEHRYTIRELGSNSGDYMLDQSEKHVLIVISKDTEYTVYSHTPNVNDDGTQKGFGGSQKIDEPIVKISKTANIDENGNKVSDYENEKYYTDIVTIPGASKLHVNIRYTNPRGQFYIWRGAHEGVHTQTYDSNFNPTSGSGGYVKSFVPQSDKDQEYLTAEFDVLGDSLTVLYSSYAYSPSDGYYPEGPYSDMVNYGYYMTVTADSMVGDPSYMLDEPVTKISHTPNIDDSGNKLSDYENYKYYYDTVEIPGATSLHLSIQHSNVRGCFVFLPGSYESMGNYENSVYYYTGLQYVTGKDHELQTDEIDIIGDAVTILWECHAYQPEDEPYTDMVNYGYYATITANEMSTDGSPSMYTLYKTYVDVVSIPGAESLHVELLHSNPRGPGLIYKGDVSKYFRNGYFETGVVLPNFAAYRSMGSVSDSVGLLHEEFDVDDDTITFVWNSYEYLSPTNGNISLGSYDPVVNYGYWAKVTGTDSRLSAVQSVEDDEELVFYNRSKPGKLILAKESATNRSTEMDFYYEIQFSQENGLPVDLPETEIVYEARDGISQDLPDLKPSDRVKYPLTLATVITDADHQTTYTVNTDEYYPKEVFTLLDDQLDGYALNYIYVEGADVVQSKKHTWKGIMPSNEVIVTMHYLPLTDIVGRIVWDDENDVNGLRPDSVRVYLMDDNIAIANQIVSSADEWQFTFEDVPQYRDSSTIDYTFVMEELENYAVAYNDRVLTASYHEPVIPEIAATISKSIWDSDICNEGYSDTYLMRQVTSFKKVKRTMTKAMLPADAVKVDDGATEYSIYIWKEEDSAYWWSDAEKVYLPEDCSYMFYYCRNMKSMDFSGMSSSKVTNMKYMFYYCGSLTDLDIYEFDTSNVTDMNGMFGQCRSLVSLNLNHFDTSNVVDMGGMFEECQSLISLYVNRFDTSSVTDMRMMFYDCKELSYLNISDWDTSHVKNMGYMFAMMGVESIDLSNFDTSSAMEMDYMFAYNTHLTSLDLSTFDTSRVNTFYGMFAYSPLLTNLDLSNFTTYRVVNMNNMFRECTSLTTVNLTGFDTSSVTGMIGMFQDCPALSVLDLSSFDTRKVTIMDSMFQNCSSLGTVFVGNKWDVTGVMYSVSMFEGCTSITGSKFTQYDPSHTDSLYAREDNAPDSPGYFTYKAAP